MRHAFSVALLLLLTACGSNPTGPGPITPQPITVAGQLTDTVTGQSLGSYSQTVASLPALITLTQPGYLPRTAAIRSASQAVDLIPESFDLGFYRQLARNGHEAPGALEPLRVLSASPSIYLQRTGLNDATVAALEQAARAVIPALTGGRLTLVSWQTGDTVRAIQAGWIMVELISEPSGCGRAVTGGAEGRIWLNITNVNCSWDSTFPHEIGHALGFYHVETPGSLMRIPRPITDNRPTERERAAAAVAYSRQSGNRDVDADSLTTGVSAPLIAD